MKLTTSKEIGIYCIHNRSNDFVYFGSTADKYGFRKRQLRHINDLNKNKHHSWILQRDWKRYTPDVFDFNIVETCLPEECIKFEQNWINIRGVGEENKSYNIVANTERPSMENAIKAAVLVNQKSYLITFPDGHTETITNLTQFSKQYKLQHTCLLYVANGKQRHHKFYKCDYLDPEKQLEAIENRKLINNCNYKRAIIKFNDKEHYVEDIKEFCKDANILYQSMCQVLRGARRSNYGYTGYYID